MGSNSSTPDTLRPYGTVAAAQRALPLLRSIARDAHATYVRLRGRLREFDEHRPVERITCDTMLPDDLREELAELRGHIRELADLGARLGDPERGIVLLDAVVNGCPGSLCWKIGEDEIRYWYPLGATYEERRPLPAD